MDFRKEKAKCSKAVRENILESKTFSKRVSNGFKVTWLFFSSDGATTGGLAMVKDLAHIRFICEVGSDGSVTVTGLRVLKEKALFL